MSPALLPSAPCKGDSFAASFHSALLIRLSLPSQTEPICRAICCSAFSPPNRAGENHLHPTLIGGVCAQHEYIHVC